MEKLPEGQIDSSPRRGGWGRRILREIIVSVLPALLLAFFTRALVAEGAAIDGPSMQPNLYTGYRVMAEKVSYHLHLPERGDVIIFKLPGEKTPLVKRVVALPGESIAVRGGHTYIDGRLLDEPTVTYFGGPDQEPLIIPPGQVFVLGDNRANSRDSRAFGPVALDSIRGRVLFIYWPPAQVRAVP